MYSYQTLRSLRVDRIKIDRDFVLRLLQDDQDQAVVRSIAYLAHELDLEVVAEGVESPETWDLLADIGITSNDRVLIRERKPELCGDFVSMNLILEDDIAAVEAGLYLMTHATNPLISAATMRDAIAALADRHLKVVKQVSGERTRTSVERLDGEPRVAEIADMIAGGGDEATALAEARRLLGE